MIFIGLRFPGKSHLWVALVWLRPLRVTLYFALVVYGRRYVNAVVNRGSTQRGSTYSRSRHTTADRMAMAAPSFLDGYRENAYIELIDRLRAIGLGNQIPLPQVVVIGIQSSGKSSVLETISGVPFPRGTGKCLVSLNRLLVGCRTTPRRQSGHFDDFCLFIRVIYTMLPPHGHCRNLYFW